MLLELAALAGGNEQPESLHQPADLVGKLGRDPDQPGSRRDQRAGQHAVEPFHAHLTIEADFRQMGQAIRIIRVGLVGGHVERGLGMTSIDADRR